MGCDARRHASRTRACRAITWSVIVNKGELVDKIAETAGLSKSDAEGALNAFIEIIQNAVASGDKVTLPGFGAFSQSARSERTARNPRTGETMTVPATKVAKFSVGAKFKERAAGR